jgi:hypothetical protein
MAVKLSEKTTKITGNLEVAEEVRMRIDEAASALVIRTLTNLYSNPYLAIFREYTSNAYDSHIKAGQTRAVEIGLPGRLNPNLVIEDFGVGLSREGLRAYGQYGLSSKTSNNDEVGGFGLGSKSGLAVAAQFTVQAVKDGLKNTAIIGFDESGHPVMKFLNEEPVPTDAHSGVKITIPTSEVSEFESAIRLDMFLGWKPGTIKINGREPVLSVHDPKTFTPVGEHGWLRSDSGSVANGGYYYGTTRTINALVGPVRYDVQWSQLDHVDSRVQQGYFRDVVLNLPIGSVDLVPSREELRYTTRTKEALNKAVQKMLEHGKSSYQVEMDKQESIKDALILRNKIERYGFEPSGFTWRGEQIDNLFKGIKDNFDFSMTNVSLFTVDRMVNKELREYWKTERSVTTLNPQFISYNLLNDKQSILITNAGAREEFKTRSTHAYYHPGSAHAANYLRSLQEKDPSFDPESPYVYFISEKTDAIPQRVRDLFSSVVDYETVVFPEAEAFRLLQAKRARENRKPAVKKELTDLPVRVLSYGSGGHSTEKEMTLGELDTSETYVILQSNAESESLEHRARRAATTIVGHEEDPDLSYYVGMLRQGNYIVLTANKSWKTEKWSQYLPNIVTYRDAIEKILADHYSSMKPQEIQAARDAEGSSRFSFGWVTSIPDDMIAKIERDETREWVQAMKDSKATKKFKVINRILDRAQTLGIDKSKYALPETSGAASPGLRYRLLADMSSTRRYFELVEYINWVDSKSETE